MGKTSTAVKRRYNEKTYSRWVADLRHEEFEKIENLRGGMSRAEFLKKAARAWEEKNENYRRDDQ